MEATLKFDRELLKKLTGSTWKGCRNFLSGEMMYADGSVQKLEDACFSMMNSVKVAKQPTKLTVHFWDSLSESLAFHGIKVPSDLSLRWANEIKELGFLESAISVQQTQATRIGGRPGGGEPDLTGNWLTVEFDCTKFQGPEIFFVGDYLRWIQEWPLEVLHYFYLKEICGESFNPWYGIVAAILSETGLHRNYSWVTIGHSFYEAISFRAFAKGWETKEKALQTLRGWVNPEPYSESGQFRPYGYISERLAKNRLNGFNSFYNVVQNSDEEVTKFVTSIGNPDELAVYTKGEEPNESSSSSW